MERLHLTTRYLTQPVHSQMFTLDIGCIEPTLNLPMSLLADVSHRHCYLCLQRLKWCNAISMDWRSHSSASKIVELQIAKFDIGCTEPKLGLPMFLLANILHRCRGPSLQHPKPCNTVKDINYYFFLKRLDVLFFFVVDLYTFIVFCGFGELQHLEN